MVINFNNNLWEPTHVTVGFFEVKVLLDSFGLLDKVIVYVKAKGSNLSTLLID
jgi:hypothetical protein